MTLKVLLPRLFSAAIVVSLAAGAVSAQVLNPDAQRARKVDEFGRLHGCDGGARLDNFAIELESVPGAKGYIIAHDARERLRGAAHAWGSHFLKYFVEIRGLDASRFVLVDAADVPGQDLSMELWLVPAGAEPPAFKPPGKKEARPFKGKYAELGVFNETTFYDTEGGSAGSFGDGIIYSSFAGLLKKQPESQGYVVVYSPPGAAPGYWRRAGTRERQKVSRDEVAAGRMTVVNGGVVPVKKKKAAAAGDEEEETYGRVELWVGTKDSPPVRHVEEESSLTQASLLGSNSFTWEEKEVADWMLHNLAEAMRADQRSVGCINVYPGDGSGVPTGEGGADQPAPDVLKIAEGWKAELLKKYGFDPLRVVVQSGPVEDYGTGRLEVWAVPQGAPLPDPFAKTEEQGDAGEAGEVEEGGGERQQTPPPVR
jgi:hypothetical protein